MVSPGPLSSVVPRRGLLQALGAVVVGGVAGCVAGNDNDTEDDDEEDEDDNQDPGTVDDRLGEDPRVLIYSATHTADPYAADDSRYEELEGNGFRHQSIRTSNDQFREMAEDFVADYPGDAAVDEVRVDVIDNSKRPDADFPDSVDTLEAYDVVVFNNTSRDVLFESQQEAFREYIESGGSFVGIHSASATHLGWEWYTDLLGAQFRGHPSPQEAEVRIEDDGHPSTAHLDDPWTRWDEWYEWQMPPGEDVELLLSVDTTTYDGSGHDGELLPNAWYQEGEEWRSWYTAGGHTTESWFDEDFLTHVRRGIMWAAGWYERDDV